ncbi:hypothetical protein TNCV_507751 [Trichonephila clavipes]|nr:hypothetical protein TNCV_507751 [Trichonephila clavipes]
MEYKRFLECLFRLGALGKIKSLSRFASSELRCLSLGRKLEVKITCGEWYPPIWYRTEKTYELSRNVLDLQCCELLGIENGSQQRENSVYFTDFFYKGDNVSQMAEIVTGVYGVDTETASYVQFRFRRFR